MIGVPAKPRIRLSSDYWADWPLWGDEGQLEPSALDLPDPLVARLRAWQDHFEDHHHWETGWRSPEDATAYAAEGRQLQALLTRALDTPIQLDLPT